MVIGLWIKRYVFVHFYEDHVGFNFREFYFGNSRNSKFSCL